MEIVVNDTNILIDLYNAGLMQYIKCLELEFRTLDLVVNEIEERKQNESVRRLIRDGTLKVFSLSGEQVLKVYEMIESYQGKCSLSAEDVSVLVYAIDNGCRLLTGDKALRARAALENVKVSGILFLTDMLTDNQIVNNRDMIAALERLLESNNRLPRSLIRERIEALGK